MVGGQGAAEARTGYDNTRTAIGAGAKIRASSMMPDPKNWLRAVRRQETAAARRRVCVCRAGQQGQDPKKTPYQQPSPSRTPGRG